MAETIIEPIPGQKMKTWLRRWMAVIVRQLNGLCNLTVVVDNGANPGGEMKVEGCTATLTIHVPDTGSAAAYNAQAWAIVIPESGDPFLQVVDTHVPDDA